jgi:hypothetical protein
LFSFLRGVDSITKRQRYESAPVPDPAFHVDLDPDPDPADQNQCGSGSESETLGMVLIRFCGNLTQEEGEKSRKLGKEQSKKSVLRLSNRVHNIVSIISVLGRFLLELVNIILIVFLKVRSMIRECKFTNLDPSKNVADP